MKLKIWIVNQYAITPEQAGITRHYTLAENMFSVGIKTIIISGDASYLTRTKIAESIQGDTSIINYGKVTFFRLKTSVSAKNGIARLLNMIDFSAKVLRKFWKIDRLNIDRPDIIIGSSPHLFGAFSAWILSRRYRVPFILEVRDIWPKSMVTLLNMSEGSLIVRALSLLEKFLYENSAVIIGVLQGVESHSRSVTQKAAPTVWIPNGVILSDYRDSIIKNISNEFMVMYTGAHGVPNNLGTALKAASIIQNDHPENQNVKLVFIGDGVEKSNLIKQAESLRLKNVIFRSPVPKTEIPSLLSQADAFILLFRDVPLYKDGFSPNKTYDYLAAGKPVIIAVDSPFDPIADADAGLSIPPEDPQALADAILQLAALPASERRAMGERGRAYAAEHYDMRGLAQKLANVLHVVADRKT